MNERYILGSKINDISFEQAFKRLKELLLRSGTHIVVTPNPEICLKGYFDEHLRFITKQVDLSIPDGFGLKVGGALLGEKIHNITTGVDISLALIELAHEMNYRVLLLGGKGKSGTSALENLKLHYPNLDAHYLNGGSFNLRGESDDPHLIASINTIAPKIIFVNLGAPKQEYFMYANREKIHDCLMLGVGGTIDFLSGSIKRAPRWMRFLHIEFLYRLLQEPSRWPRILNAVIRFPITCVIWRIRNMFLYRNSVVGMIVNSQKQILLVKRSRQRNFQPQDHWQLPQGGVEKWQTADQAILEEMKEELGLQNLTIIAKLPQCYKYQWGKSAQLLMPFRGQKQSLYLLKYEGDSTDIKVDNLEIDDFRWVNKDHALSLAHPFRKKIIEIGLEKFKPYL